MLIYCHKYKLFSIMMIIRLHSFCKRYVKCEFLLPSKSWMKMRMHAKLVLMAFPVLKAVRYTKAKSYCSPPLSVSLLWGFVDSLTVFIVLHLKAGRGLQSKSCRWNVSVVALCTLRLSNWVFRYFSESGCEASDFKTFSHWRYTP